MPVWPVGSVGTANMDAGTDSPAVARSDIKQAVDDVNSIIAARGVADGIPSLDSGAKIPIAQLPATPLGNGMKVFSTPGSTTWTVPAGIYRVKSSQAGGGGGGGYTSVGTGGDDGGGGGAGGVIIKYFDVVPGSVFNITIGDKGTGHGSGSDGNGTDGGDTILVSPASATPASNTLVAGRGLGGLGPPNAFGGGGGSCTDDDPTTGRSLMFPGGAGISGGSRGGAGGGNHFSSGAAGGTGYGGAGGFGSGHGTPAFDGLKGFVQFEY